jgi:transcriptional regulator with XRE-family HTH domain
MHECSCIIVSGTYMNIHSAVRSLRDKLDISISQQALAVKLGLSVRAIASYEKARVPALGSLHALMRLANEKGFEDEAAVFRSAIVQRVGLGLTDKLLDITVDALGVLAMLKIVLNNDDFMRTTHPAAIEAIVEAAEKAMRVYDQLKTVTPALAKQDIEINDE